jgi:biotin operon repressor
MKLIEQLQLLDRLDQLIRRKATGTPAQLASRLEVSERTVYNLIDTLRQLGAEVSYNKCRGSYQYDNNEIVFRFDIVIAEPESKKTKGGKTLTFFSDRLQNFCSEQSYF